MINRPIFWIAFCVFVCKEISLVQTDETCKTHADCTANLIYKFCCGGDSNSVYPTRRMCGYLNCLNKYCKAKSDCGNPTLCCRSNMCVDRGCYSCTLNLNCSTGHVCCKKSFPSNQAFCAKNCVGERCNNNDDCAAETECCRSGKCTDTLRCYTQCKSNSECDLGNYCCKKKSVWFWQDRCIKTCVGEDCSSDDDCGPPNECCVAGKCAKDGCPESSSDSTHTEQTPKEYSPSPPITDHIKQNPKESSPSWLIPVIVIAVLLAVVGLFVPVVLWQCYKRKRPSNTTQVNEGSLQNTGCQGTAITNPQPNHQFTGFNNPMQQAATAFGLDPSPNNHQQSKHNSNPAPNDNDGYANLLYSPTD